jgi:hypothetical protein
MCISRDLLGLVAVPLSALDQAADFSVPVGRVVFEIGGGNIREEIAKQGE